MNDTTYRWACWHPKLGYLRFSSYSEARATPAPDPRGCFARRVDAEKRQQGSFYCKRSSHNGSEIKLRYVSFTWALEPDPENVG